MVMLMLMLTVLAWQWRRRRQRPWPWASVRRECQASITFQQVVDRPLDALVEGARVRTALERQTEALLLRLPVVERRVRLRVLNVLPQGTVEHHLRQVTRQVTHPRLTTAGTGKRLRYLGQVRYYNTWQVRYLGQVRDCNTWDRWETTIPGTGKILQYMGQVRYYNTWDR